MAERRGQVAVKDLPPKATKEAAPARSYAKKARKLNRSMAGNALLFTLMFICGVFMALPLVMIINNALKPLDELYQFPPKIFVRNPNPAQLLGFVHPDERLVGAFQPLHHEHHHHHGGGHGGSHHRGVVGGVSAGQGQIPRQGAAVRHGCAVDDVSTGR